MDKPSFKYTIYMQLPFEFGDFIKIYKSAFTRMKNGIGIKICVFQLLKNRQDENSLCLHCDQCRNANTVIQTYGPHTCVSFDQEYSKLAVNVKMACSSYLSLTNCKYIEVSPVVNDLRKHENILSLKMHKHSCPNNVKIMQTQQSTI